MPNVLHSGDLGDIIYALPVVKAMGDPGIFYITTRPWTKAMTPDRFDTIAPLLRAQSYIKGAEWWRGEHPVVDMSTFRSRSGRGLNLVAWQAQAVGVTPWVCQEKWLEVEPDEGMNGRILLHRSARYHNDLFPWTETVQAVGKSGLFIGPDYDFWAFRNNFGEVEHRPAKDYLELARWIAGCEVFIGNQSSPFAIAEGLKHESVLEVWPTRKDCCYSRGNVQHVVGDEGFSLRGVRIRTQPKYFETSNPSLPITFHAGLELQVVRFERTEWSGACAKGVIALRVPVAIRNIQRRRDCHEISETEYDGKIRRLRGLA